MESQASSQSNSLPTTLLPRLPLPWPTAYQQYPFCAHPVPYFSGPSSHGCYSQHWVYPHCIHVHASTLAPPICHKCSKFLASPSTASSITGGFGISEAASPCLSCPRKAAGNPRNTSQVSAGKFSNGFSALSNVPCRSAVKQEMPTGDASLEVKCPAVQSPMAMHPPGHAPAFHPSFCSHPQFTACPWSHGCWYPPCLLSMRHSMPPQTVCPRAGPVPFPSMPPLSAPKCNYIGPELNRPETLLTKFANGLTPLHFESWQGNEKMDFQDFQDSEVQYAEELEDGDDEPIFVLTDEYAEFFAKSEARRQESHATHILREAHRKHLVYSRRDSNGKRPRIYAELQNLSRRNKMMSLKVHPLECLGLKSGIHLIRHYMGPFCCESIGWIFHSKLKVLDGVFETKITLSLPLKHLRYLLMDLWAI